MTTVNSVVTTGETVDSSERRQPGQGGLVTPSCSSLEGAPTNMLRRVLQRNTPRGAREGGWDEHPKRTHILVTTQAKEKTTTSAVCRCGKVCKNPRGLKIHQTKIGCLRTERVVQRTVPVPDTAPGETEEELGPETPHSAQNPQAPQAIPQSRTSEHRQVLWPAANKESEWRQFDEDVDAALEATAKDNADQRLQTMSTFIISIASERFGAKDQRATKTTAGPNLN